ncbi:hypothetical protein GGR51DRAFT_574693 [Nemania sp. FL0031]|nr:hypothetical protein GGR51DRAFT_574693 [Nemania sp. FL0031]
MAAHSRDKSPLNQGRALVRGFMKNTIGFFEDPPVRGGKGTSSYVDVKPLDVAKTTHPGFGSGVPPAPREDTIGFPLLASTSMPDASSERVYNSMKYWVMLFPSAMEKFPSLPGAEAPKSRKPEYDIRNSQTWVEVYEKLDNARRDYTNKTGLKALRRGGRWVADNATETVRVAVKAAPQSNAITPVLGVVHIILEALKKSSKVRKETLKAFDELEEIFSEVEDFLGIFYNEGPILKQVVNLIANVLLATERGIEFFTQNDLIRGAKAVMKGEGYEEHLLDSLREITLQSKKLRDHAMNTYICNSTRRHRDSSRDLQRVREGQEEIIIQVKGNGSLFQLLLDKFEAFMQYSDRRDRAQEQEAKLFRNFMQRFSSAPPSIVSTSPGQPLEPSHGPGTPYISQEELWDLLKIHDIDKIDLEEIEREQNQLSLHDRAQTEQIVHNQAFQNWIVSPKSTKLMIYSNFSGLMLETSALSLFCTTLAHAFRSRRKYLCLVWFCGRHLGHDDSDYDSDYDGSDSGDSSDVNLGYYEDEFAPANRDAVIQKMMRSLIAQLLCNHDFDPGDLLPPNVDLYSIEDHSLSQLRSLFCWLVRRLPEEITLFCLIDGAVFYEREEFEDPMFDVLADLLEIIDFDNTLAVIKLLVTSPRPTSTVRMGFEDEDIGSDSVKEANNMILCLDSLTLSHVDVSEERVNRTLVGT